MTYLYERWAEQILRTGGLMSPIECTTLWDTARQAPTTGEALEVGHYTGLSTCVLLAGLPKRMRLHTVDNHSWRRVPPQTFVDNTDWFVQQRDVRVYVEDMQTALPKIDVPLSFVFYDAGHSAEDCAQFFDLVYTKFTDDAMLLFDDADWEGMRTLEQLAQQFGFTDITQRDMRRHTIGYVTGTEQFDLDLGKRHPDTYTLRIMQRSN